MNKIKLFSLLGLLAVASLTLTNCGTGSVDVNPELTFGTESGFISEDISLASNTAFKVEINGTHDKALASLIITVSVDGGADVPVANCGVCDTVLTANTFTGVFNGTTGATAGVEKYTFTLADGDGQSTSKSITITNLGSAGESLVEFTQDNNMNPFRVYNFIGPNSGAYQIGVGNLFAAEPDNLKDIQDSVNTADGTNWPARWTSRNGSTFKLATSYNWGNVNNTSELEAAWNASGTAQSVINVVDGDTYIINIKNGGTYALIEITDVEVTTGNNLDYVQFRYKFKP